VPRIAVEEQTEDRRYFTMMPNIVDEMDDLSPYAFRLYMHFRRVAGAGSGGQCWQSTRTLAEACNMSTGSISKAKKELEAAGLIEIRTASDGYHNDVVTVMDIWAENIEHFQKQTRSGDEQDGEQTPSRGEQVDATTRSRDERPEGSTRSQDERDGEMRSRDERVGESRSRDERTRSSGERKKNMPRRTKHEEDTDVARQRRARPDATSDPPRSIGEWEDVIRRSKNRQAALRWMIQALFPYLEGPDLPDHGYVGTVANRVGGACYLARLLWQASVHRPQGDVLAYVQAMDGGSTNETDEGRHGGARRSRRVRYTRADIPE